MSKLTQFFGQVYTGERAEFFNTSIRIPKGLNDDALIVAAFNKTSRNSVLSKFFVDGIRQQIVKDCGGLVLEIDNPQEIKQPNDDTRAEIMQILADVAALKIDERAGFKTGINELINYHFEKLCKENNGSEFTGNYFGDAEMQAIKHNTRKDD